MTRQSRSIGVLALQGSFSEHMNSLSRLGAEPVAIRLPDQLKTVDGLVIPGGESTTILKLLDEYGLREPLVRSMAAGLPVLATCAGVICLADHISSHDMEPLRLLHISVSRNGFGRQIDSFEEDLSIATLPGPAYRGVFIRAPVIESIDDGVEVLARLTNGAIVACRQGNIVAACFHPEFVDDLRFHTYFLNMVEEHAGLCST
ncbi:pyridoxal 5'-phosphate synthase glutaminase subunit PdxT [Candidatus Bipolaricaulota bacterium]|nr:pyridoxal 5'-phosphate synthase glutaminase subunit PdxT [Candidatus Bipolaricaulota bacterium]